MTTAAGAWVAAHAEQPPAALRTRLDAILNADQVAGQTTDRAQVAPALFDAGRSLLSTILGAGSTQRDAALDLLTADALVTYAFEAAAGHPADLDARAAQAMRDIAGVLSDLAR
jgi:hypothetical protein